MVPPVLAAKEPVLLPVGILPVDVSDTELNFAVLVSVRLDKDEADPWLVNPVFDSEDPEIMTVDIIAVVNEDPETATK